MFYHTQRLSTDLNDDDLTRPTSVKGKEKDKAVKRARSTSMGLWSLSVTAISAAHDK